MKRIDPKLSPEQLRERAFRAVVRARQWAEKAEGLYRAADRRERRLDDKVTERWPWPCKCGAAFASDAELRKHVEMFAGGPAAAQHFAYGVTP